MTDEDVDVTNLDHLIWAMLTRTDPEESIQFIEGSWDSPADPRAVAGETRRRRHDAFGRHHQRLQALSLARQVSAEQCAEPRGGPPRQGKIRLAARRPDAELRRLSMPVRANHDIIIIGAGSAGCTLAGRLTEDAGTRVLSA